MGAEGAGRAWGQTSIIHSPSRRIGSPPAADDAHWLVRVGERLPEGASHGQTGPQRLVCLALGIQLDAAGAGVGDDNAGPGLLGSDHLILLGLGGGGLHHHVAYIPDSFRFVKEKDLLRFHGVSNLNRKIDNLSDLPHDLRCDGNSQVKGGGPWQT